MGIFSFFRSSNNRDDHESSAIPALPIDLGTFQIGSTSLDAPPSSSDPFHSQLTKADSFKPKGQGIELGTDNGRLDHVWIDLKDFQGSFSRNGQPLKIGRNTSEQAILTFFGEPYWTDRSDGEVILFYEYKGGAVELQFEFPDGRNLGFITLLRNGVLSDPESRKSYDVDKPWPPL